RDDEGREDRRIEENARPNQLLPTEPPRLERLLGRVANESPRTLKLVHHLIAGVDTLRAGDTLELEPLSDVDARGAGAHAGAAVDAVSPVRSLPPAGLAPRRVIADDEGSLVEEHRLQACVRTRDRAHLLAEPREV